MRLLSCPECERVMDIMGLKPGATLTCVCGQVATVPHPPKVRTWHYVLAGVLCLGFLALAVSSSSYHIHRPQSECKANLKEWYKAQRALFQEKDFYSKSNAISQFEPERGNRYAYFSGPGPLEDRSGVKIVGREQAEGIGVDTAKYTHHAPLSFLQLPMSVALRLGISGKCPQCNITLACMGQLDQDETLDVWTISTADRKDLNGVPIAAGQPFHDVDDLRE